MDVDNTSPELVMMAPHSSVCDDRPKTNEIFDGVIPTDATKEDSAENSGSVQGIQVGWTLYSGDTEPLHVPKIPPASSWISPKRILVSTFTQGGTPKPLVCHWGCLNSNHYPFTGHHQRHFLVRTVRQTKYPPHWS